jgi:uncharacterized ferritin-like protein (DUF455 family)
VEIRAFARGVVTADTLDAKLTPPPAGLKDDAPGPAERLAGPGRPSDLRIAPGGEVRVPRPVGMADAAQRPRIVHALANHELQAIELFAWALLAFPDAPSPFRRGLLVLLADEQRHFRLYAERLAAFGVGFGDLPVSGHFWNKTDALRTPLQFVCTMGLTFENANLDFALELADAAHRAGDDETADVLARVHADEIRHVAFAWTWLERLKRPEQSMWEAYCEAVPPPHGPQRARGARMDRASREAAGFDSDFIERLERIRATAPGGGLR